MTGLLIIKGWHSYSSHVNRIRPGHKQRWIVSDKDACPVSQRSIMPRPRKHIHQYHCTNGRGWIRWVNTTRNEFEWNFGNHLTDAVELATIAWNLNTAAHYPGVRSKQGSLFIYAHVACAWIIIGALRRF